MFNKKGQGSVVLIIILAIVVIVWLVSYAGRQCNKNEDCKQNFYCGADFKCHEFPVIVKEVEKNNLLWPSVFLSLGIIGAALILRGRKPKQAPIYQAENPYYSYQAPQPYPSEQEQNPNQ
jgi:hypothetical protein